MRRILIPLLLFLPALARADEWIMTSTFFGNSFAETLTIKTEGGKVTGTLDRQKVEGTLEGKKLHLAGSGEDGSVDITATVAAESLSGTVVRVDADDPQHPNKTPFTARPMPKHQGPAKRYDFKPTAFHRVFSADIKPVLKIWPGDTVHTTTVDAGGTDEQGVTRVLGGNPQTGPFYVETAMPGDVLAVHLVKVRLNRDWAISDDAVVGRALTTQMAVKMKDGGKTVRWRLDREHGVAMPEKPTEHLSGYTVPLKPMLGCVAVAPGFAGAAVPTGDSGRMGGNMDYNQIVEGTTVYLPVAQEGALLYLGDGHAAQGDGELTGNALETSMEVELTVDVLPGKPIAGPRVESPTHIMALGLGGSVDDALRSAVANLSLWLEQEYQLTPSEIAQVLGTALEIRINEVADRNAGVAVSIDKARLAGLKH